MAENASSAENELLKTIEGNPFGGAAKPKGKGLSNVASAVSSRLSFFLDKTRFKQLSIQQALTLEMVGKELLVLVIILVVWYGAVIVRGTVYLGQIPRFDISRLKAQDDAVADIALPLKDYAYYTDILLGRNIFNPSPVKKEVVTIERAANERIRDMVSNFRVVGLSWSDDPAQRYAMIEDTKTQLTFFLMEGDTFSNITVKNIKRESVVLSAAGEETELR